MAKIVCNLLLVEDDEEEIERFARATADENKRNDVPLIFELLVAKSSSAALKILNEKKIHFAVIDLRIPSDEGDQDEVETGNDLLRRSLDENTIPHIVHSSHTVEISDDVGRYVKIIEKVGGEYPEVFEWFYEKAGLISVMQTIQEMMMKETALLFRKSILPNWEQSRRLQDGNGDLPKILLRQIVSHLGEYLSLPMTGSPKHHLFEVYFRPPLREERLHTGDLVSFDQSVHVIVTPQCNMANEYPDHFLLARCNELQEDVDELRQLLGGGKKKKEQAEKRLIRLANQQVPISCHFLPPCGTDGPWMVDFKAVVSVPQNKADQLINRRIASMSPQFIPNLIHRFRHTLAARANQT